MLLSTGQQIGLQSALRSERNLLYRLKTSDAVRELQDSLWSSRAVIESICAYHLGLDASQCTVADRLTWMRGQFNICIPITATQSDGSCTRKLLRCVMPHKVGGQHNADEEKVRVEAANYAYVEESCPEIPVAGLVGFGFRDCHFTHQNHLGFLHRMFHCAKRLLYSIGCRQGLSRYARRYCQFAQHTPYLLLDFIEARRGKMLSDYWQPLHNDHDTRHENLYRSLSRLTISLGRRQQSHIGALRFDDNGIIHLLGPPLLCGDAILEAETGLEGLDCIYTSAERFVYDSMAFRDRTLRAQPNAAYDEDDCRLQMAYSVLLRALAPQMIDHNAPFVLQFTDLHASNLFVDEAWNITGVIDLEFMCSLPTSMLNVPYWLAGEHLDGIAPEKHASVHAAFMEIFQHEEALLGQNTLSRAIQESWASGAFWMYHCLTSVNALPTIMEDHLWKIFGFSPSLTEEPIFANWLSLFWSRDSPAFVAQKVADRMAYAHELRQFFDKPA